ncbi:MAG: sn-glycerol-3-phosphate ABC transporter ATP-binding protein UgpC [Gemmatimonadaceae bacterium]|nr:sn-glycerol-3-phosphate ABC transporter ATP-binding protein UgpC [Gemmatimonadaceae bacterium]
MARIALEKVDKTYPNGYVAASGLDLEIADGELLVLVGPSGSGKSTILRLIAGLEGVTAGTIRIGDRDVTALPPQERDIAMVFQSYALYPHMTVRQNLGFGLRIRKMPSAEIARRVAAVAETLGLSEVLDRRPSQLSGGQRQRVALGRAIVREPLAFLFDEPLSNLDAQLRVETRAELSRLHRRLGATMVYVTHDQVEAMTLGDRVAVLKDGVLQQVAPPMELYRNPANRFVAGFIGSPAMNFIDGAIEPAADGCRFTSPVVTLPVACAAASREPAVLGVRPQHLTLDGSGTNGSGALRGQVVLVEPLGSEQIVHVALPNDTRVVATVPPDARVAVDETITLRIAPSAAHLFRAHDGRRIALAGA